MDRIGALEEDVSVDSEDDVSNEDLNLVSHTDEGTRNYLGPFSMSFYIRFNYTFIYGKKGWVVVRRQSVKISFGKSVKPFSYNLI